MKSAILGVAVVAAMFNVGTAVAADGKAVYDKGCGACHNNMDPKLGDKAKWGAIAKQGVDALGARREALQHGRSAFAVEAETVDDRRIFIKPEQARLRVAGLGQRRHRARLDKTETERQHRVHDVGVLVEARDRKSVV